MGARAPAVKLRGEAQVDRLVRDLLVLANRTRAAERSADVAEQSVDDPAERALTRRAAIAGTVLLRNESITLDGVTGPVLPIDPATVRRIAVIGPNADIDRCMGGGSASLTPFGRNKSQRFEPQNYAGMG